ncbi:hypothetical protein AaE_011847 [Aphanomyces astaci]|uniref:Tyrosine specific protein phosphatases domain-containing protein n=1 Tax=Aphanomyces astaci TaxID=112090 RepID=A0A6A4ZN14_APHAT|nr:hypothetical protein AaE_011847 [Aphanomyces astaci]
MLCLVHGLNSLPDGTATAADGVADGRPVVVHCSAGIGRSGTFIAIDIILRQLRAVSTTSDDQLHDALDVRGIVHRIRSERPGMVQTAEQYQMIYQYIRAVLAGQS